MTGRRLHLVEGSLTILEHCSFAWEEDIFSSLRTVFVRQRHCLRCISEILKLGFEMDFEREHRVSA